MTLTDEDVKDLREGQRVRVVHEITLKGEGSGSLGGAPGGWHIRFASGTVGSSILHAVSIEVIAQPEDPEGTLRIDSDGHVWKRSSEKWWCITGGIDAIGTTGQLDSSYGPTVRLVRESAAAQVTT